MSSAAGGPTAVNWLCIIFSSELMEAKVAWCPWALRRSSLQIFSCKVQLHGGKKGALVHNLHHVGSKTNWPQPSVYLMPSPITDLRRLFFHVCGHCPKLQEQRLPKIAVSAPWSVHFVQELNKRACWTKTRFTFKVNSTPWASPAIM